MSHSTDTEPEVVQYGMLSVQVCVPTDWKDDQVRTFTNSKYPCGTDHGWHIRRDGDPALDGDPERNPCSKTGRDEFVHITLDA